METQNLVPLPGTCIVWPAKLPSLWHTEFLIFSSPLKFGVTLRQKYQFVRPEKNTKVNSCYGHFILRKRTMKIRAEFGIRWVVLKQFLYRAACYVRTAFSEYLYLLHSIISGLTN
jgi:hypothetical protein